MRGARKRDLGGVGVQDSHLCKVIVIEELNQAFAVPGEKPDGGMAAACESVAWRTESEASRGGGVCMVCGVGGGGGRGWYLDRAGSRQQHVITFSMR